MFFFVGKGVIVEIGLGVRIIRKQSFTLAEISKWATDGTVDLPNVQRGFVWKPNQIENFWDSILRGYPLGALVLAENTSKTYDLLDGQQRATAVCLGFGGGTFRKSEERIKVFIDLEKPHGGDARRYIIRVITKSHPWGYQNKDNSKPLDSDCIQKAMQLYEIEDHLEHPLSDFFPYEADLPIPLEFFIQSETLDQFMAMLDKWPHWIKIENRWLEKNKEGRASAHDRLYGIGAHKERIGAIFLAIRKALDEENGQKIPALYLNREMLTGDSSIHDEQEPLTAEDDQPEGAEKDDEVETLFIRLNSGGTPLRGEELNYSILKAHIELDLQKKIENACDGLLAPARFITIAFRLFQNMPQPASKNAAQIVNKRRVASRDAIQMRVQPKQFQRHIGENSKAFVEFLEHIIDVKEFDKGTLLEQAKYLLTYEEKQPCGLPYPIVSSLASRAPEVMFMLLYRLIRKDTFVIGANLHKRMVGMVSLFLWFGKGQRQRDHSKLLSNIWPCVKILDTDLFWSSSTVQRAMLDSVLPNIPGKKDLLPLAAIKNLRANVGRLENFIVSNGSFGDVVSKAFFNRDLILFAQRQFLAEAFKKQHFNQEDTNVPFDWDHISPNKLIENKKKMPKPVKEWYNTNGNFRAWPYSLNRFDQDGTPENKLDPLNAKRIYESAKYSSDKYEELWRTYFYKNGKIFDKKLLKQQLLKWSFCSPDWAKCKVSDLKKRDEWIEVCSLIINRNINIYSEWHDELLIGELTSLREEIDFGRFVNRSKWIINPDKFSESFNFDIYDFWISRRPILDSTIYLYFGYPKADADIDILAEDVIEFGLFEEGSSGFLDKVRIPEGQESRYVKDSENYIYGQFTLVSSNENSYLALLGGFNQWLQDFSTLQDCHLATSFLGLLKSNIRL